MISVQRRPPAQPPPTPRHSSQLHTAIGASCWFATSAYLGVQAVVAAAWEVPYDLVVNSISDLGVTTCGNFPQLDDRVVYACSPRHAAMNAAFVAAGVLTALGALLTRPAWPRRRATAVGLTLIALAGVGGVLIGLAPANVNLALHGLGALLQVPGAVAPLLFGAALWPVARRLAVFSVLSGTVGSAASLLYFGQIYLALGPGVMERVAIDTLTLWMVVTGVVLLRRRGGFAQ